MDRSAPSDVELLEMAREVLSVCSDHSLKDVISDLTITRSSELTINRILDRQFLTELAPPTIARAPEGEVTLLSSSEDDGSDGDEFLRTMSGLATKAANKESKIDSTLRSSLPMVTPVNPLRDKSNRGNLESTLRGTSDRCTIIDDELTTLAPASLPESDSTITNFSNMNEESQPVVIDLNSTPTRKRKSTGQFKLVSPMNNDAFSDWDFELIPCTAQGSSSPTVLFTSPRSPSRAKEVVSSLHATHSHSNAELSTSVTPFLTTGARKAISKSVQHSKPPPSIASPKAVAAPLSKASASEHSSRNVSPYSSDPLSKIAPKTDDIDWDFGRRTETHKSRSEANMAMDTVITDRSTRWDSLIDTSLSPPILPLIEDDESDLEDIMNDMPWKVNGSKIAELSRSSSAKSLGKGKRGTSTLLSVDLQDWDDHLDQKDSFLADEHHQDELISLEEEIVDRAKRRQKKAKSIAGLENNPSESTVAASDAELRKAEKETQRQAKEAERQAKVAERLAKKAAREQELTKRRELKEQELAKKRESKEKERLAKEEEKQADKMAARETRINSRLSAKSDASKEMILCIEESLYQSTFGQTLQDYLANFECQVDSSRRTEASTSAHSHDSVNSSSSLSPIPNLIFWRRVISHRYDDDQDIFVPIDEKEVELEPFSLIYVDANDFASMIQHGKVKDILAAARRDMKLMRNKERLKMSSMSHHRAMPLKEHREQRQRIIFLISGIESYLRDRRKATTKRFQQAVLASLHQGTVDKSSLQQLKPTEEEESAVSSDRIEQEMNWLHLEQDCFIIQTNDEDESAQALITLTEQIGHRPYKDNRRIGLNVCVDGIRSGVDPKDTWIKSLQEIHMVTHIVAKSIAQEYPTIKCLYEGYQQCTNVYQAQLMLEDIPVSVFVDATLS
ncbi:hypothetical protein BGX27_010894 [Mortierella sp. AM989]|nr:hypothetical protein BGX27_010894 [Mortierella sp. AM989]